MNRLTATTHGLLLLTLVIGFGSNNLALAQGTGPVTFEAVVHHALSTSPLVREIDAALSTRLAEALSTRLKINPQLNAVLGLPSKPAGESDKTQINAVISQQLRPSDFGTRKAVAEILASSAAVEQKLSVLELTQNVYLSYAKLWVLQEQRKLLIEQRDRAQRTSKNVNAAAERGAIGKGEGGLFSAECKKLSAQLLGIDADSARERALLLRLSTLNTAGRELVAPESSLSISAEQILQNVSSGSLPIQSRYELLARVAAERQRLARQDAFPSFSPQFTYQRTEDGGEFFGAGVQFDLPLFNRNQPQIMQRRSEQALADAKLRYSRGDSFKEEVTLLLQSLRALEQQAETFQRDVIPALFDAIKRYDEQFITGTGTVLTAWQAQRELSTAQLGALELWMKYFQSRSELSILIGQQL